MKKTVDSVPENLRCRRTDSRKWRCKRQVMDDKKYCEIHHHYFFSKNKQKQKSKQQQQQQLGVAVSTSELTSKQIPGGKLKKRRLIDEKQQKSVNKDESLQVVPDYLRCNRTDGKNWRCKRRVVDNLKLCEIHRHRGRKDFTITSKTPKICTIRSKNGGRFKFRKKKKTCIAISEALDEALKRMKLKKGDLQLELIRMFLWRQIERRKVRDYEANCKGDLMKVLPNGLMAISPALSPSCIGNVGPFSQVKIGVDPGFVTRRCFRSKNIEPLPVGPLKEVPFAKNLMNVQKVKRKNCHLCFKRGYRGMIKGSGCQKHYFCDNCTEERCLELDQQKEVKETCPVCRGTCSCEACLIII